MAVAEDAAPPASICSGISTDNLEGMKGIAREATMHAAHSQRAGLRLICADRSSASAANPISKLVTRQYRIQDNILRLPCLRLAFQKLAHVQDLLFAEPLVRYQMKEKQLGRSLEEFAGEVPQGAFLRGGLF